MSTQSTIEHRLNDLIEIARDGKSFYEEAATKVKDAELSALFTRIAGVKGRIVAALSGSVVASGGKPAEHGTVVGSMQQFYGKAPRSEIPTMATWPSWKSPRIACWARSRMC